MNSNGFVYVRGVLSAESVALFAEQLKAELRQTGPDAAGGGGGGGGGGAAAATQIEKKRKTDSNGGSTPTTATTAGVPAKKTTWAEDRTTPSVSLDDRSTWPRKGTRRVVELAPLSDGSHWDELLHSPKLGNVLDDLLGADGWDLRGNSVTRPGPGPSEKVGSGHSAEESVRHWYCPVVFPENGPDGGGKGKGKGQGKGKGKGKGNGNGNGKGKGKGNGGNRQGTDEKRDINQSEQQQQQAGGGGVGNGGASTNTAALQSDRNAAAAAGGAAAAVAGGAVVTAAVTTAAAAAAVPKQQSRERDIGNVAKDKRRDAEFLTADGHRYRPMRLCSWKEELHANGLHTTSDAWWRWQPVNRRRVCGKGWHIDIGPGFDLTWERTLSGHPYQGVVMLVLLSDWEPGLGGTVLATGSQEWVRFQIKAGAGSAADGSAGTDGVDAGAGVITDGTHGASAGAGAITGSTTGVGAGAGAGAGPGPGPGPDTAAAAAPTNVSAGNVVSTTIEDGAGTGSGNGLAHKVLNQMCIDHMLRLARSERIWIPLDETTPPCKPDSVAAAAPPPPSSENAEPGRPYATPEDGVGYTLHQVCGKAGDVLLMHPWLIHCGSINCGTEPRLMANGMVRIKQSKFDADGGAIILRPPPA